MPIYPLRQNPPLYSWRDLLLHHGRQFQPQTRMIKQMHRRVLMPRDVDRLQSRLRHGGA